MKKRLHAVVFGMVQGVSFRYFAWSHAQSLGISGFVRNTEDSSLEVVAEGEQKQLEELLELLKQGPSFAVVKKVSANWHEATNEFSSFSIEH